MWVQLFKYIGMEGLHVTLYWMPSHTDTDPKKLKIAPKWLKPWHVAANKNADVLAGIAAASHAIPSEKAKPVIDLLKNLHLIQNRIIVVTKMYPQRPHNAQIVNHSTVSISQQIQDASALSTHILHKVSNRLVCASCNASVSVNANYLFEFIASNCFPEDKLVSLAVGKLHTHPSHTVIMYGGVLMCTKCGSTARNKLIKLQHVCYGNGPETGAHGLDNIERYAAGRTPRGYSKWPYNHFKLSDIEIQLNVQNQVNKVPLPILPGTPKYESSCGSDTDDSDINEDLSSSGSSSSD